MSISLKKVGVIGFTTGMLVPGVLAILGRGLGGMNVHPGMWLSTLSITLWPTGLMLIDADANAAGYTFLVVRLICNGFVYALTAVLITYYVKLAKNRGYD